MAWVRVTNTADKEIFLNHEHIQFMRWDEEKACTVVKLYGGEAVTPNKDGGNLCWIKEKPDIILGGTLNVG